MVVATNGREFKMSYLVVSRCNDYDNELICKSKSLWWTIDTFHFYIYDTISWLPIVFIGRFNNTDGSIFHEVLSSIKII